jgi:Fur family peroxide stress response transcriptional regulator
MPGEIKYKRSRQRDRILALLRGTTIHPTAGWIYDQLKSEFKGLSMGTVYRNLTILVEQGLVTRMEYGSTFDRFDGNASPHYHFICEKCGSVLDLPLPVDSALNKKVDAATGYQTKSHRLEFYGICDRCRG